MVITSSVDSDSLIAKYHYVLHTGMVTRREKLRSRIKFTYYSKFKLYLHLTFYFLSSLIANENENSWNLSESYFKYTYNYFLY